MSLDTPSTDATSSDPSATALAGVQTPFVARVDGEEVKEMPQDLYIPPEALRVFLETFEGPLDLLLYLIRRQNLDILAVNVAAVTHQYIEYVDMIETSGIDLAAEYLLMAAMLAEIKSRSLLPRQPKEGSEEDDEDDPTAQLIERLKAYEQLKLTAETLDTLPRMGRDWFGASPELPPIEQRLVHPDVSLDELLSALGRLLNRVELRQSHQIEREALSTRERMSAIISQLRADQFTPFESLFSIEEGKTGVVVTFMALLELCREQMIEIVQNAALSPIHVRLREIVDDDVLVDEAPFADAGERPYAVDSPNGLESTHDLESAHELDSTHGVERAFVDEDRVEDNSGTVRDVLAPGARGE